MQSSNLQRVVHVAWIFNDIGGTAATVGQFFATLTVGYGLVTEFTY